MFPESNHVCLCADIRLILLGLEFRAFSKTNCCINADLPEPLGPTMNNGLPLFSVSSIGLSDILGITQFISSIKNSFLSSLFFSTMYC